MFVMGLLLMLVLVSVLVLVWLIVLTNTHLGSILLFVVPFLFRSQFTSKLLTSNCVIIISSSEKRRQI